MSLFSWRFQLHRETEAQVCLFGITLTKRHQAPSFCELQKNRPGANSSLVEPEQRRTPIRTVRRNISTSLCPRRAGGCSWKWHFYPSFPESKEKLPLGIGSCLSKESINTALNAHPHNGFHGGIFFNSHCFIGPSLFLSVWPSSGYLLFSVASLCAGDRNLTRFALPCLP